MKKYKEVYCHRDTMCSRELGVTVLTPSNKHARDKSDCEHNVLWRQTFS